MKPRTMYSFSTMLAILLVVLLALGGNIVLAEDAHLLEATESLLDDADAEVAADSDATDEAARAAAIADRIYAAAAQEETTVTPLLQSLENDSIHLTGLEHRLKTPESIARKLLLNAHDMEIDLEEAVGALYDALRYTFIIDDDRYISDTDAILKALVEQDYKVEYFRNSWGNDGYKGINTNLRTPGGYLFEIQFHTQDSFETKEYKTHALYEIARSETSTEAEKQEANAKQRELFAAVPVPEGAVGYTWNDH